MNLRFVLATCSLILLSSCQQTAREPDRAPTHQGKSPNGLPEGGLQEEHEAPYQTVYAVESEAALRAALRDLHGETEIRLIAGEFAFDTPVTLGGEVPRRLKIVGQGPAWTRLVHRAEGAFMKCGQEEGENPIVIELANLTIRAPHAAVVEGSGEGMLVVRNVRFEGSMLATASRWFARWFPRDDEGDTPPPMNVAGTQRANLGNDE